MKVFGSLRTLCLAILLVASTLSQEAEALNAIINYNSTTMWMYNYFRAYLCDGVFPEQFCTALEGALVDEEDMPETEGGSEGAPTPFPYVEDDNVVRGGAGSGGILGLGIFGGGRQRRNLRA